MFFNICTLINNARNYQFQIQPNTNLYPYICYEGQKVDTILNGGGCVNKTGVQERDKYRWMSQADWHGGL